MATETPSPEPNSPFMKKVWEELRDETDHMLTKMRKTWGFAVALILISVAGDGMYMYSMSTHKPSGLNASEKIPGCTLITTGAFGSAALGAKGVNVFAKKKLNEYDDPQKTV